MLNRRVLVEHLVTHMLDLDIMLGSARLARKVKMEVASMKDLAGTEVSEEVGWVGLILWRNLLLDEMN
jgi:hypothetical protein